MAMQGQERLPNLHQVHGNCLREMGEYRNAAEAYKLVLETSTNFRYCRSTLVQVVDNLLFVYEAEQEQTISTLYEAVYWFVRTCGKYQHPDFLEKMRIDKLRINHPEALGVMIQIMKDTKFGVALTSGMYYGNVLEEKLNTPLDQSPTRTPGIVEFDWSFAEESGYFSRLQIDPITDPNRNSPQAPEQFSAPLKDEAMELKGEAWSMGQEMPSTSKENPSIHKQNVDAESRCTSVQTRDNDAQSPPPKILRHTRPQIWAPPLTARNRKGKKYDFFVSHSSGDKYWVYYDLLPKLEREYNFKGCIDERDFIVGENILTNIEDCMNQSVCTVLILTKAFCESRWCQHEMTQAINRRVLDKYPVIPIRVENCDLPQDLRCITYQDAVEHCDWEKLVRNLDNMMELR